MTFSVLCAVLCSFIPLEKPINEEKAFYSAVKSYSECLTGEQKYCSLVLGMFVIIAINSVFCYKIWLQS